jgi:hypothetical protein
MDQLDDLELQVRAFFFVSEVAWGSLVQ